MKRIVPFAIMLLVLAGVGVATAATDAQSFEQIRRGRYLAIAGNCAGCHMGPDGRPYVGGKPLQTPFGVLLGANLTPDKDTGIGRWSDDDFVRALRKGIGRSGRHLYPAMPYPHYTHITRDDALAIRAYLNTLAPVRHHVVTNQLPFPFNIRASMAAWNALYFSSGEYHPDTSKSAEWNRGGYIVEALAHCGVCHTPLTSLGGEETEHRFQGGTLQGWLAPNITADPIIGIGGWSEDEIAAYLKTGHNTVAIATGPMAEVITDSTSKLSDSDRHAIAVYLKDQPMPARAAPQPVAKSDAAMRAGQQIYADACSACHQANGKGITGLFPALAGSPAIQQESPRNLIRVLLSGAEGPATATAPTAPAMPTFGWKLNDRQIAGVLTFIRNSWGNAARSVDPDDVREQRSNASSN